MINKCALRAIDSLCMIFNDNSSMPPNDTYLIVTEPGIVENMVF